jgi:hypothetical protein
MSRNKHGKKHKPTQKASTRHVPKPVGKSKSGKPIPPKPTPKAPAGGAQDRRPVGIAHWADGEWGRWALLIAILIATWLVYWGTGGLDGGWLLDDYGNIVNNNGLVMHHFSWQGLWHAMHSFKAGPLGRPLSLAMFALERFWTGLDPTSFKAVNLVMHLGCVILLYGFTRALLHAWRRRRAPHFSSTRIEWVALGVAAAWALHPMNLTPVLYVVQRETIFAALFTLAGLWLYVYIRERFRVTSWPVLILLAVEVIVFTALGAFAKETGVLLPLFLLVLEAFVFRFGDDPDHDAHVSPWLYAAILFFPLATGLYKSYAGFHMDAVNGALVLFTLLLGAMVCIYLERRGVNTKHKLFLLFFILLLVPAVIGLERNLPGIISGHRFLRRDFTLDQRVLTEGRIVLMYIFLIVIPWLPGMALHHDYITLSNSLLSPASTLGAFLILAALLLLAWALRRRRPLIAMGIIWFFASQVLESTIFPLELAYEHRVYLGDWGLIVAVAALVLLTARPAHWPKALATARKHWPKPLPTRTVLTVLSLLVIVLLGSLTATRAWHWRSNLALARYESYHHPTSPRGTYLVARIETNRALSGQTQYLEPAFEDARTATQVPRAGLDPWTAMILLAAQTGRPVPDSWFDGMVKAIGEEPFTVSDVNALQALISCYNKGQCQLKRSQLKRLFKAIHESPRFKKLGMNYANVLVTQANFIGYSTRKQRERSAPLLLKAANAQKHVARFQINVFNVALEDGKLELAQKMLKRTEKLNKLGQIDRVIRSMQRQFKQAKAKQD